MEGGTVSENGRVGRNASKIFQRDAPVVCQTDVLVGEHGGQEGGKFAEGVWCVYHLHPSRDAENPLLGHAVPEAHEVAHLDAEAQGCGQENLDDAIENLQLALPHAETGSVRPDVHGAGRAATSDLPGGDVQGAVVGLRVFLLHEVHPPLLLL